ncbi:GFA family protein [Alkalimarinus sediminis]|uniref:GFA family protein n=1 Tax=Alkalimarinus sediminis TaxID=1632866 RepID=A0A9E8HPF8_9ALTE|nr:GFA family protein [Alkalimarinus sediminis]UZW76338.1 GFA family protein [Alkalimarinus sediminis]
MADYSGSCLCESAKFIVQGEFDSFYLCHCQYCQKDTGSAHAANLFSNSAKLVWLQGSECVASFTLPGTRHTKSFCKTCGSALPTTHSTGLVVIPAGSLDSEVTVLPTAHILTASRAVWDAELELVPQLKGLPS